MSLKVTILVENTVGVTNGVVAEWGLSMLLDFGDERILLDTGEQGNIVKNARALGIDLRQVDKLVLSHGHYDHTGGLMEFLKSKGAILVYAHPNLFMSHYGSGFSSGPGEQHYLGVPFRQEQLESAGSNFIWQRDPVKIRPGLWLSGEVPRKTDFERIDERLVRKDGSQFVQDLLPDDVSLFYESDKGLVIFFGCAHAGLVNIIEHAKKVTGIDKVRAIIGGTHLGPASPEQKEKTIAYLKTLNLEVIAPNHCTGLQMASRLSLEFPAQFKWASAGLTLEF
ncbi:MBL fold metallo-hydrolase [Desulfosporosinus sp. PR]|uniref:MBL fold metallo-hydrolase n=1 Tax=Candidatus Desulfosporosinus nitrosoreducens TaxID=3401928 RepID=UPI0027F87360|nr:MBL fold metallo-hydrolase [Desulfosporosinus sp. PR]MDQ7094389.1 MBL fold metallo-hydrolase [Desulfosporosinus sp. PR]